MSTFRAVLWSIARNARRLAITVVGFVLLLAGLFLALPGIPGPGILVMLAGLAVLAQEYVWARKALEATKKQARRAANKVRRRKPTPGSGLPDVGPAGPSAEDPSA